MINFSSGSKQAKTLPLPSLPGVESLWRERAYEGGCWGRGRGREEGGGSAGTGAKSSIHHRREERGGAGADSRQILSPPSRGFQIGLLPRGCVECCPPKRLLFPFFLFFRIKYKKCKHQQIEDIDASIFSQFVNFEYFIPADKHHKR